VISTGYKHVYRSQFDYGKPFYVAVRVRRRLYNVGYFATISEAASAARGFNKAIELFWPTWRFTRNSRRALPTSGSCVR
jgi:hypothetical protein